MLLLIRAIYFEGNLFWGQFFVIYKFQTDYNKFHFFYTSLHIQNQL